MVSLPIFFHKASGESFVKSDSTEHHVNFQHEIKTWQLHISLGGKAWKEISLKEISKQGMN